MLLNFLFEAQIVAKPEEANVFVDDIIDSGTTRDWFAKFYPGRPFYALVNKLDLQQAQTRELDGWIVFPWESSEKSEDNTVVHLVEAMQEFGLTSANLNHKQLVFPPAPMNKDLITKGIPHLTNRSLEQSLIPSHKLMHCWRQAATRISHLAGTMRQNSVENFSILHKSCVITSLTKSLK
jgi:hypothetical protein